MRGSFTAENAVGVVEANLAIDEEFEQASGSGQLGSHLGVNT